MNTQQTYDHVRAMWQQDILPALHEYIRIPCKSVAFDPDWAANGHMDRAVSLAAEWVDRRKLRDSRLEVLRLDGRTPVVLLEVEGTRPGNVLVYGHLDKQPEFDGWREDLGPWKPVLEGDRLYGRGGADDGYAIFGAASALEAIQAQGGDHPRVVVLIECSEESGSPDLPAYVEAYADRIGRPDLVICLDSGAGDYDRLWWTTSLRGNLVVDLEIDVLTEGIHSGDASGVVPSSFRVARILLDRLEEAATGRVLPKALHVDIPMLRRAQAEAAAWILREAAYSAYPWAGTMGPTTTDPVEAILNRTWRPQLSVTGATGLPEMKTAGNVLRPTTGLRLSLRLPPTLDPQIAESTLLDVLTADPPYDATVRAKSRGPAGGWSAPEEAKWLTASVQRASTAFFGQPGCGRGEGGTIPFMGMLGEKFPEAQFLITGVLGPSSNAHGPNEFLHVPTAERLSAAVAHVICELPSREGA